jgi:hypothetical protein
LSLLTTRNSISPLRSSITAGCGARNVNGYPDRLNKGEGGLGEEEEGAVPRGCLPSPGTE